MKIRSAVPADAARLLEIYSYYVEKTAISFEYAVPTEDEFRTRIKNTLRRYPYLVLEKEGVPIGYAYAGVFKNRAAYDRSSEVSVYIDRDERRKGYGRMLYGALEEELRLRGIYNMYACIAHPRKEDEYLTRDSEKFHSRLGFIKVGEFHGCAFKFGRRYDMIWMEKIIADHGEAPSAAECGSDAERTRGR